MNLYNNLRVLDATKNVSDRQSTSIEEEDDKDDGIVILYETMANTSKHPSSFTKSKFFPSKIRRAKNTNDASNENTEIISLSNKKKQGRSKAFWQIHDLK